MLVRLGGRGSVTSRFLYLRALHPVRTEQRTEFKSEREILYEYFTQ